MIDYEMRFEDYIIEAQQAEIRMYRNRISVLNNSAAAALLLGESMTKILNKNIKRRRIIAGEVGIVDGDRTNKEVKCNE